MTRDDANLSSRSAADSAQKAVDLYAKPIGVGATHSIEHQGPQVLAEAIRGLADGLAMMATRDER
ncbi:hypothetical protein [Frondihabitans peucedani]|uniref:hypothetical protein n=1 Tax=Frondihabitans peucedani TaxID=598626 RepID=UPI0031D87F3C